MWLKKVNIFVYDKLVKKAKNAPIPGQNIKNVVVNISIIKNTPQIELIIL